MENTSYTPNDGDSIKIPPSKYLYSLDRLLGDDCFNAMALLKCLRDRKRAGEPDVIFKAADLKLSRPIAHLDLCGYLVVSTSPEYDGYLRATLKGAK